MADYKMAAMKSMNTPKTLYLILVISQTRSWYLILHFDFQSTKSNVKCFKIESKMAAVKMTRKYAFFQLWPR